MDIDNQGAPEGVTEDTAAAALEATETDETLAQGDEQSGDDAAAATDEPQEGQQPKRRQSVQERIDEKTRLQKEAERRAEQAERDREYWREQALRNQQAPSRQDQQAEEAEPNPEDYEHGTLDVRFITDLATFRANKAFEARRAAEDRDRERYSRVSAFNQAAEALAEKTPDFYEVVGEDFGRVARVCTQVMTDALLSSEAGPQLGYHLAKNPSEARRIAALPPLAQAMAIGELKQKLASPPAPTPKTATDAPAPTPQVRGAGGRFTVAPDTDDFAAFEKQYGKA
jgi:hypothetical protein